MKAIMGIYYKNKDKAIKKAQEEIKRKKRDFEVLQIGNEYIVISKNWLKQGDLDKLYKK